MIKFKEIKHGKGGIPVGIAGLIFILILIAVGGFYIHTVNRVTKLDGAARNLAGDIDTLLWDRNHVYETMTEILEKKGISLEEDMTKKLALSLGMSPTLQMTNHTELHRRRNALDQILEQHPELKEDEEFSKQLTRFDALRTELIGAASKYNESARIFNGYIEKPFASFIAAKKTKGTKNFFSHELAEVTAK